MTVTQAVAFDLGGVLVDVDLSVLPRSLGRTTADIEAALFGGSRHDRVSTGRLEGDEFLGEAARALGVDVEQLRRVWGDVVRARDGARDLVDRVPVQVVAWSNTDPIHVARLSPALPERLFDGTRALSYELAVMKPDPLFTDRAIARLGVPPAAIFFVDDRSENVDAARAAGVDAAVARSLDDVTRLLRERGLLVDR